MSWPRPIAPWRCGVVKVASRDALQREIAEELTAELESAGLDVLYEDRNLSPGVKLGDADVIGLPCRITVGRDAAQGQVEFVERRTGATEKMPIEAAEKRIVGLVRDEGESPVLKGALVFVDLEISKPPAREKPNDAYHQGPPRNWQCPLLGAPKSDSPLRCPDLVTPPTILPGLSRPGS
jgi:hypothetical protein